MSRRAVKRLGHGDCRHATTYTVDGVTDTIRGWSERIGCSYNTLYKRICLQGRDPEGAIRAGGKCLNHTYVTIDGESRSIAEWGRVTGVDGNLISSRISRGWDPAEAVGLSKRKDPRAVYVSFNRTKRRISGWAKELGIDYGTMRARVLRRKKGEITMEAMFHKGKISRWLKVRKLKHQNWYKGKRISIDEICARKGCGRTWVCSMYKLGFTATQIIDRLEPCRDQAEMSRRQAASQRRNRRIRELKQIGLIV